MPRCFARLLHPARLGEAQEAARIETEYSGPDESLKSFSSSANNWIIGKKAALQATGICHSRMSPPCEPVGEEAMETIRGEPERLGLI